MLQDIKSEIRRIKKERGICLLAHSYQSPDICEVADFVGDSYAISVKAAKSNATAIVMCGVRFMAETAKILSPNASVILASPSASCPMADQMNAADINALRETFPGCTVVTYINTTAELKTACDVCVTSSSAVKIVEKLDSDNILFVPDCNLGSYVAKAVPHKTIHLVNGGCPIHASVTQEDVLRAKAAHPGAKLLVHPECVPDVVKHADVVGSTADIMDYAETSDDTEFIIGTETHIVDHLRIACPGKVFHPLTEKLICADMRITTLEDVLTAVKGEGGEEIRLSDETIQKASRCIHRMIELG